MKKDQNPVETFGRWLRLQRRRRDLTQQELGDEIGCSPETVRKMEADAYTPSKNLLIRLARFFELPDRDHAILINIVRGSDPRTLTEALGTTTFSLRGASRSSGDSAPSTPALAELAQLPVSNLPLLLTPLLGREPQLQALHSCLGEQGVRLLTLTGPGGIGKTRLALQVAAEMREVFQQRVFFIPLAPLLDPDLVLSTIAQHLELKDATDLAVAQALGSLPTLLVLDNLEHLLPVAPRLGKLLSAAPRLTLLVTSRAPLHLYGEYEFQVPPLALPDLKHDPSLADLAQVPTVALFVDRARAVSRDFSLTEENASSVVEICQRLDGLPLAIELAAARSKLLSPDVLLSHLTSRLALLTDGPLDVAERHQTLRKTISWSYTMISPAAQTLFARLGVFAGGATMEAIEAVCVLPDSVDMNLWNELTVLLDNSLIQRSQGKEIRFSMLQIIREYALEQLEARGEAETLRSRHARYFADLLKAPATHFYTPVHRDWINRCNLEYYNLQDALAWASEQHDVDLVLALCCGLSGAWRRRGHLVEGRRALAQALDMRPEPDGRLRLDALLNAGVLAFMQDDYVPARDYFTMALTLERQVGTNAQVAYALYSLGLISYWQGDYDEAVTLLQEGVQLYTQVGERFGQANLLLYLGMAQLNRGLIKEANELHRQSVQLYREVGDPTRLGGALTFTGRAALYQGLYQQARWYLEESLSLLRMVNSRPGIARGLVYLGRVALAEGVVDEAEEAINTSLNIFQQVNDREGIATSVEALAGLSYVKGDAGQVARLVGAAAALRSQIGAPLASADRPYLDRLVEFASAELGATTFDYLWHIGQSMAPGWWHPASEMTANT